MKSLRTFSSLPVSLLIPALRDLSQISTCKPSNSGHSGPVSKDTGTEQFPLEWGVGSRRRRDSRHLPLAFWLLV
jgi:hypothetical protein